MLEADHPMTASSTTGIASPQKSAIGSRGSSLDSVMVSILITASGW